MSSAAWKLLHEHLGYEKNKIELKATSLSMLDEYADLINNCKSVADCDRLEQQVVRSLGYHNKEYKVELGRKSKFLCCTITPSTYDLAQRHDAISSGYGLIMRVIRAKRETLEGE